MQVWYLAIQILMLPIVLLAAYVGWVLPDVYIQKITQAQAQGVDSFLSTLTFSNPIDEETGKSNGDQEGKDVLPETSVIAEALIQAKQAKQGREREKELQMLGPYLSGQYMPSNRVIAQAKASGSGGAKVLGTVPGSQAEEAGVRKGWLLYSINDRVVSSQRPEKVVSMLRDAARPLTVGFHQPYQRSNTGSVEVVFEEPGELGLRFEGTARMTQDAGDSLTNHADPLATGSTKLSQDADDSPLKVVNPLMDLKE